MKTRFTPFLLILFIIAAAILSRFVGASDYLYAQSGSIYGYTSTFFYCPYNKAPYTDPNSPYRTAYTAPNRRFPSPYRVYYYTYPPSYQYPPVPFPGPPCPCTTPAVDSLLLGSGQQ